ncbi:sigma-70 family RNA polymerase sigma factor [Cryptosporangium sp. NPDC051539]|uniref:sigma-70 family RNA polymerase sigma factor n=1 Tax=Cryptosporangium sp. NPDC051539 TaxID=3363962 RepID=UPI0037A79DA7
MNLEQHRRELHVHCYRMLASFDEAEDAVQETFLRAWRGRERVDGSREIRAWLYRIATNVCLDVLRSSRSSRRLPAADATAEASWLQPYPDQLLDELSPEAITVARETIELAFIVALQVLPPRQRAVFLARDVLGWRAAEAAQLLEISVPAANSALQRARSTLATQVPARSEWSAPVLTADEKALLAEFVRERGERSGGGGPDRRARHPHHDAARPPRLPRSGRDRTPDRTSGRPDPRGRLAADPDRGQPDARGRELPAA